MQTKKKLCDGDCGLERFIWKNHEGKRYCLTCWNKIKPVKSLKVLPPIKKIKPVSEKRKTENIVYAVLRKVHLKEFSQCQARLPGCTCIATEIHHKKGRIGALLTDVKYWLSVCRHCHDWIENHPEDAKKFGLSLSRLEKDENNN